MNEFLKTLKRHGTAIAFIAGFVWDNIMLSRIDHWFANAMLGTYLGLSAICIIAMNMSPSTGWRSRLFEKSSFWLPLVLQFCFGSLFSAYLILYTRSASIASDWPFLVFLVFLVISNELLRKRYLSITLPGSIFFIVLFSYSIFSLPVLVNSMGDGIFILSGIITVAVFFIFSYLLFRVTPEKFIASRKSLFASVIGLYFLFNLAYFGGLIPPVPLALKEIGVYHSVTRVANGNYKLTFEPRVWYQFLGGTSQVFHWSEGGAVYVWNAVFAPTELKIPIFHRWQYFNVTRGEWVVTDLIHFSIVGGRDQGYRGYSFKTGVFPGQWRVDVETPRGDLIGRIEFTIEAVPSPPDNLQSKEK